ncbi:hypothetical protein GF324_07320 [bacterium]|nr:hypothetical protein [bacterium]
MRYSHFITGFAVALMIHLVVPCPMPAKTYAFLTPARWAQFEHSDWAIPRESPDRDTLAVKPLHGPISHAWMDSLHAAGVDTSADALSLDDARLRVSAWADTTEVPQ